MMATPAKAKGAMPPMPWKLRLVMAFLGGLTDVTRRADGSINRRVLSYLNICTAASLIPYNGVRTSDVELNSLLKIRIFAPVDASPSPLPVLIFFHGGGFAYLSAMTRNYDAVCRRFARKIGAVVVSVDYRLAPEHKCPAPYDDGIEVMRYIDSGNIKSELVLEGVELDLSSCFLIGDSAGANIVHHVTNRYAMDISNWNHIKLVGSIAIQPFFGGEETTESEIRLEGSPLVSLERTEWLWKAFLPEGSDRNHEAANVFSPELKLGDSFPPVMMVIGGYDPLQDWQRRYYEMLKKKGKEARLVEYPNAVHAFYVFPFPESKLLLAEIKSFVEDKRFKNVRN